MAKQIKAPKLEVSKALDRKMKVKSETKSEVIESALSVEELKMKNLGWSMKLKIKKILPKSYHDFMVRFIFNEEPYETRIKQIEERMENNKQPRLLKQIDREEMDDLKREIHDVERERAENKRQCITIEFLAQVEQLKYDGADTILSVRIPDNIIEPVNKVKMLFGFYKVELTPQI
jgi:hypothetical protein